MVQAAWVWVWTKRVVWACKAWVSALVASAWALAWALAWAKAWLAWLTALAS